VQGDQMRTLKSMLVHCLYVSGALLLLTGCMTQLDNEEPNIVARDAELQQFMDRQAIEQVLSKANLGFELGDTDLFAGAFAEDAEFVMDSDTPVFGYQKLLYSGRKEIREIITDRLDSAANADPSTLSYDPDSLRRYNRNSNSFITFVDETHARHITNWMVTMKTNVDIHISAIGRYEDELVKRDGEWFILRRVRSE
jgi:hypothetical protein